MTSPGCSLPDFHLQPGFRSEFVLLLCRVYINLSPLVHLSYGGLHWHQPPSSYPYRRQEENRDGATKMAIWDEPDHHLYRVGVVFPFVAGSLRQVMMKLGFRCIASKE